MPIRSVIEVLQMVAAVSPPSAVPATVPATPRSVSIVAEGTTVATGPPDAVADHLRHEKGTESSENQATNHGRLLYKEPQPTAAATTSMDTLREETTFAAVKKCEAQAARADPRPISPRPP
jgi:hypothetical protein